MRRILIVDDEPRIVQAFGETFSDDYKVAAASDGEEALRKIRSETPDLVVLDWRLRGKVEGREVLCFLKENFPAVPVFVVTASVQSFPEIQSLGADECLVKPCPDLRERILAALPPAGDKESSQG